MMTIISKKYKLLFGLATVLLVTLTAQPGYAQLTYTTGLDVWLDASDVNGNGDGNLGWSVGDPIVTWVNKGTTGGGDATQGNQGGLPALMSNITPGGYPALDFSANNQSYQLPDFLDSDTFSMFIVAYDDSTTGSGAQTFLWDYGDNGNKAMNFGLNGGFVRDDPAKNTISTSVANIPADDWGIALNILSESAGAYSMETGPVGATVMADNPAYVATTWEGTFRAPHIGAFPDGSQGNSFGGYIAEMLVFDHAVTGTDRDAVVNYLQSKYSGQSFDPTMKIIVDRQSGQIILSNGMESGQDIEGYNILSEVSGALKPGSWTSIAENYDEADGDSSMSGDWMKFTDPDSREDIGEGILGSSVVSEGASLALGNAYLPTIYEDLVFEYLLADGTVVEGIIEYVGDELAYGDLNHDGVLDSADWVIVRDNHKQLADGLTLTEAYVLGDMDADGDNDVVDFGLFKITYNNANGPGTFEAMVASVPEPASMLLLGLSGLAVLRRRQ